MLEHKTTRRGEKNQVKLALEHIRFYVESRRDHKRLSQQASDLLALLLYYRYFPYHYVKHHLYFRTFAGDVCDYIPPLLLRRFIGSINPEEARLNVFDKARFAEIMRARKLSALPTLAIINRNRAIQDHAGRPLSYEGFVKYLGKQGSRTFFIKPTFGVTGTGVCRAEIGDQCALALNGSTVDENEVFEILFRQREYDSYLVQSYVRQHRVLNDMNPMSVNTVRIDSYVTQGELISNGAVLRIGSGKTYTDNWSTGGYITPIDLATGQLGDTGKTKISYGRELVDRHPITGVRFGSVKLPHWAEVKAVVKAGADALRPLSYLGWDIAIAEDGPVIIEANHPSDVYLLQEGIGGMRNTRLGRDVIQWL